MLHRIHELAHKDQCASLASLQICGRAASILLGVIGSLVTISALAQQAPPASTDAANGAATQPMQEVVVTGTSIRGVSAPVGASLVTLDQQEIAKTGAQTMQQVLANVPAVTGFGSGAQGSQGSADGSGTYAPTIHGLGASASNGTLVLVDGHRLPLSGINHTLADPNIISPLMVQQVEVLPQGASSTYGSDAVAGVINIITLKNFNGLKASAEYGFADNYNQQDYGVLWGSSWDNTSVLASFNYERRSSLSDGDRSFTRADHTAQGGGNFATFNCSPAAVQPSGSGSFYLYPYTNGPAASPACDSSPIADLLPEEARSSVMVKISHDFNDRVSVDGDLVYSNEMNWARISSGTFTGTAYGPGSQPPGGQGQINPYFQGPPGVTSETVDFDADDILNTHAQNAGGAKTIMGDLQAVIKLAGDWQATLGTTYGENASSLFTTGTVCTSCALLALNGTTNPAGSLSTPSIPGTSTFITSLPLTTGNALNVWSPTFAGTSASVLQGLNDNESSQVTNQALEDWRVKFDGTIFQLPGGALKAAVGGEYIKYSINEQVVRNNNTGPASAGSNALSLTWGRDVKSAYAEILVPVFGNDYRLPFLQTLVLDISGRHDDYSDVGSTDNPRLALNWSPIKSLTLRGDYSRSFTAPSLTSSGDHGITAESGFVGGAGVNNLALPNTFPGAIGLPGCTAATRTCVIGTPTVTGIELAGPNPNLKPETGNSWSAGFDWAPPEVSGLKVSLTYWNISYSGMITSPQSTFAISSPSLAPLLTLYPGGATQAQLSALTGSRPQTGAVPSQVYWVYNFEQQNALNLQGDGIDGDIAYTRDTPIGMLSASLSESLKLKMMQQFGSGGPWFSILNTSGFNTTFPSQALSARLDLGWAKGPASVHFIANYVGGYDNWNGSAPFALIRNASFDPIGGGQYVHSQTIFDLYAVYDIEKGGVLSGAQASVTITNLSNESPPFYNSAAGYDSMAANPIGRTVLLGLSKKW